ncbi:hypothetical protein [Enterococcus casseliflavus]|uniref:hypothetical protein n=1 Tax=Enterococcus casseliflavus TaxID=37734 RepID=UPI001432B96F|nr:hypothetical protein [Enterococcus casseliflavus]NKD31637.1 hypothetical protein [Enterococcus casseliflavus]
MKNIKRVLSGSFALLALFGGIAQAAATTIDGREGQTEGSVPVNGIIGSFDNTQPGPDPTDPNHWINVTIPTTALFYTTGSDHTTITSPSYTIRNNSARGVEVYVTGAQNVVDHENVIDVLNIAELINGGSGNEFELINDGVATTVPNDAKLFTINATNGTAAFGFHGTAKPTSEESNPSFQLVLNFAPLDANGNPYQE